MAMLNNQMVHCTMGYLELSFPNYWSLFPESFPDVSICWGMPHMFFQWFLHVLSIETPWNVTEAPHSAADLIVLLPDVFKPKTPRIDAPKTLEKMGKDGLSVDKACNETIQNI